MVCSLVCSRKKEAKGRALKRGKGINGKRYRVRWCRSDVHFRRCLSLGVCGDSRCTSNLPSPFALLRALPVQITIDGDTAISFTEDVVKR